MMVIVMSIGEGAIVSALHSPVSREPAPFPFSFDEYSAWYSDLEHQLLEPARQAFVRILNQTLDQELSDVDRLRIRVSNARIKNASRLWTKMLRDDYVNGISALGDIPARIDDMVGIRITCNNLSDVEVVRDIVLSLASIDPEEMPSGLCIDPHSERRHSKESGYRAWHINLHTLVAGRAEWLSARGELQVRTLLQDSWGDLTHEDTYKPGTTMPQLVTSVAKQMAGLLAAVDDLAQVLRTELDSLALRDVGAAISTEPALDAMANAEDLHQPEQHALTSENQRESLLAETRRVVSSLTRPAPLAQVAWQVQANFGRTITTDWGGFGTFKELLRQAVPDVSIVSVPPGTVVPSGAQSRDLVEDASRSPAIELQAGVPEVIARLRRRDSNLPAVPAERLSALLELVAKVLRPAVWQELDVDNGSIGIREINTLTKRARDLRSSEDAYPPKAQIDYVLKSLYFSQNLRAGLDKAMISEILGGWLFARANRLGLVTHVETDRAQLEEWLASAT